MLLNVGERFWSHDVRTNIPIESEGFLIDVIIQIRDLNVVDNPGLANGLKGDNFPSEKATKFFPYDGFLILIGHCHGVLVRASYPLIYTLHMGSSKATREIKKTDIQKVFHHHASASRHSNHQRQ